MSSTRTSTCRRSRGPIWQSTQDIWTVELKHDSAFAQRYVYKIARWGNDYIWSNTSQFVSYEEMCQHIRRTIGEDFVVPAKTELALAMITAA
jgi:hypothetical protein